MLWHTCLFYRQNRDVVSNYSILTVLLWCLSCQKKCWSFSERMILGYTNNKKEHRFTYINVISKKQDVIWGKVHGWKLMFWNDIKRTENFCNHTYHQSQLAHLLHVYQLGQQGFPQYKTKQPETSLAFISKYVYQQCSSSCINFISTIYFLTKIVTYKFA